MDGTNQPKVLMTSNVPTEQVLTERDIVTLLNLMHNFSYKWNEIGLGLGFVPSELTQISSNPTLIMSAPASFLRMLLSQWVQWPIMDHPTKPTLEALCEALCGSLAGLGSLAEQVERELKCSSTGSNGSASHPVGHPLSQPGVAQPGVTQLGVPQPEVTQLVGIPQPGVMTQRRVVQQGALQLHNTPQHVAAGFQTSCSDDASPELSSKPRLHELDLIAGKGKTVNVIDETACVWEKIAMRLHFEGHDISRIRRNERQAEDACRTMFAEWLEGKGRTPTTWSTILQALNEARRGELANNLEEVLDTTEAK